MNFSNLRNWFGPQEAEFLQEEIEKGRPYSSIYFFDDQGKLGWLLTLRTLSIYNKRLSFDVEHFLFWNEVVYPFKKDINDFAEQAHPWVDFVNLLEDRLDKDRDIAYLFYDEIEHVEDRYYQRDFSSALLNTWFDLKKETSRIDRFLGRLEASYRDLVRFMDKNFPELGKECHYVLREVKGLHENVEGLITRLDNSNNYYVSLKNDRLNRNIYFLTLLSGIFLPLNLIVGFFGMNTEGLFFKENPQGTMNVVYLLVGIFLAFILGSSILKLVDRLFIKWWLGKTKLHSSIVKKLESFEENWKA